MFTCTKGIYHRGEKKRTVPDYSISHQLKITPF
jgi:hypothetical protein